ncbi:conserved hypothetical protein [Trichinella spiralis]|uniref:hypothetical protein n=1 Tax=Trichinella spiralis TaxID=6334 RepID=UPI0001EFCF25|nr:conserved hypothetical protein [Trichinella spiralis]
MYINIHDFRTMLKDYEYADQANAPNKKSVVRFLRRNTFPDQVATVQHEVTEERKIDAHLIRSIQITTSAKTFDTYYAFYGKSVSKILIKRLPEKIRCTAVDSMLNITAVVIDFSITAAITIASRRSLTVSTPALVLFLNFITQKDNANTMQVTNPILSTNSSVKQNGDVTSLKVCVVERQL